MCIRDRTKTIAAQAGRDYMDWALYGGEDYELVGCIPFAVWENWQKDGDGDNPFKAIGTVTADSAQTINLRFGEQPYPALDLSRCFQHIE